MSAIVMYSSESLMSPPPPPPPPPKKEGKKLVLLQVVKKGANSCPAYDRDAFYKHVRWVGQKLPLGDILYRPMSSVLIHQYGDLLYLFEKRAFMWSNHPPLILQSIWSNHPPLILRSMWSNHPPLILGLCGATTHP